MGSFSIWHWLIVLTIVLLLFGTKRLRGAGADLGSAVQGFREKVREGSAALASAEAQTTASPASARPADVP